MIRRVARMAIQRSCRWTAPFLCLLLATAGCQTPAGHFGGCHRNQVSRPYLLLGSQLAGDTAIQTLYHPLHTTVGLVAESGHQLASLGGGFVDKHLLMPFKHPPYHDVFTPATGGLGWQVDVGCGEDLEPAAMHLYVDGERALAGLQWIIEQAHECIDVLMFQWENDPIGAAVAQQLAAKAGPHLRVRILVDGGGNLFFGEPCGTHDEDVNRIVCSLATHPYVEIIRTRNPFAHFDHRKLVIADGQIAWTGGRNFTQRGFSDVHDLSFTVEGPLVQQMERCFEQFWREQGGRPSACRCTAPCGPDGEPPIGNALARLVRTEPATPEIQRAVYYAVDHACQYVFVENFSVADSRLLYKLACARSRGVDVRVILTESSCSSSINRTNRVSANRLLHAGVRVYMYPAMTHVKAALVDGTWVYTGTGNFDQLSFRHNHELGVVILAGPVISAIQHGLFEVDFHSSREVTRPFAIPVRDYLLDAVYTLIL